MNGIKVLFMGNLKDVTGEKALYLDLSKEIEDTDKLKYYIYSVYPGLKDKISHIALNEDFLKNPQALKNGDEIVFMPPFSGG